MTEGDIPFHLPRVHLGNKNETVDLGPNMFASGDRAVINWFGENYYRACSEPVRSYGQEGTPGGMTTTTCVKPSGHPGLVHEDFQGDTTEPQIENERDIREVAISIAAQIKGDNFHWERDVVKRANIIYQYILEGSDLNGDIQKIIFETSREASICSLCRQPMDAHEVLSVEVGGGPEVRPAGWRCPAATIGRVDG